MTSAVLLRNVTEGAACSQFTQVSSNQKCQRYLSYADGPNAARYASDYQTRESTVSQGDRLTIQLVPAAAGPPG